MQNNGELILEITKEELLSFIGRGTPPLFYDKNKLATCAEFAGKISRIKYVSNIYRIAFAKEGVKVLGTTLVLTGEAIREHLSGCSEIMIFAVTLGREVDEAIARAKYRDLEYSYLLDSAAELLLDKAVDKIREGLTASLKAKKATPCFSAGYADFPLESQTEILEILSAKKYLGILLSESVLMSPLKSVTAVIGIKNEN